MAEQAYAYVTLIPVAKGFQQGIAKELGGVEGIGGQAGQQLGKGMGGGFSKGLKGLIGPAIAAVSTAAIGGFVKESVNAASALSAEYEGVNQIFGAAAKSVQDFADQAAYSAGISETAALQAAKGFGVFAGAAGLSGQSAATFSTDLVQAAGDLASFNDVPVEETLAAIKSGLQGQGEPLSKFGILMNEATLKEEALRQGIITTTTEALTPQQKVLAANALILENLGAAQGDFTNYAGTFGNALKTTTALFDEMRAELGEALLPALEQLLPTLQPIIEQATPMLITLFEALVPIIQSLAENMGPLFSAISPLIDTFGMLLEVAGELMSEVLPLLVTVLATVAPIVSSLVEALMPLITLVLPALIDLVETVLPILTGWWQFLAGALIPVIEFMAQVIGVTLAVAISAITKLFQLVIGAIEPFFEAMKPGIINLVTDAVKGLTTFLGPLMAAIKPVVDALLNFAGIDPADLKKTLDVKIKVDDKELAKFQNVKFSGSGGTLDFLQGMGMGGVSSKTDTGITTGTGAGGKKDDTKAQLQKVIKDTREAFKQARKDYQTEVKGIRAEFNQSQKDIAETYDNTVTEATKRFNDASVAIAKRYNEQVTKANQKRDESLASALKDHNKRISEIQNDFAKRQADIVQQSMDRLRDAYKSAVSINVASIFDSDELAGSIEGTVQVMRDKLLASQQLLDNAAKLNAMGFSQTFIEQVVASGTDLGNELANSILGATPDTIAELKSLYGQLESQSETAMDSLAQTIYDENGLATSELKDLYASTQTELTLALEQQAQAYQETVAAINADFQQSIADAQLARDEAMIDAQAALDEAILNAKIARDKALQETEKDLQDALIKAGKNFNDDITKIEKTFKDKIASMKGEVGSLSRAISDLMNQLAGAKTAVANAAPTPKVKLAQGGIVTGPTNALIGEAGPEIVIPLDRFESMMGMGSGGQAINYYAAPNQSLDSERELFQAMKRAKVVVGW